MDFLIELSLILFLTFISKGHTWTVNVTKQLNVTSGSEVNIQCSFSYPQGNGPKKVEIFWKRSSKEKLVIRDKDKNEFIYHQNDSYVTKKYKGRTKLTGDPNSGDCSLSIQNITENEPKMYLRIHTEINNYSFVNDYVSVRVSGLALVTNDPDFQFPTASPNPPIQSAHNTMMYTAIFVSLAAVVIIIVATGIVCFKKHRTPTRRESSYYVNFKGSSIPPKREPSLKKQDNKELPEQKVTDDPVYINLQVHPGPMDQSAHADNIYANVDYTA